MADFIRLAGRGAHIDLYDAELHDLTVEWVARVFGFNGASRRFLPGQRTTGGVATYDPGCGNENKASCDDDERRCGFAYSSPIATSNCDSSQPVPPEVDVSDDGTRSRNWERRDPSGECGVEDGHVGAELCACPRTDLPVPGTGRYFAVPGLRFPLIARSSTCSPEYVGDEVGGWLAELDEAHGLIAAGWEVPAVFGPEPPVKGAGAAERIDALRGAVRGLLAEGETDFRLLRLPGNQDGGVGAAGGFC